MTHDEILKAARERLAEIDREKARLEDERGKLQALLGVQPTPKPVAPWITGAETTDVPKLDTCPTCHRQRWTIGAYRMCSCMGQTHTRPFSIYRDDLDYVPCAGIRIDAGTWGNLVIGGTQGPNPSIRYTS